MYSSEYASGFSVLRPGIWPHLIRLVTNGNVRQVPCWLVKGVPRRFNPSTSSGVVALSVIPDETQPEERVS